MKKEFTITFRATKKTKDNINNIRKQLAEEHGFIKEFSDSQIIREALSFYNEKLKYTICESQIDWYKKNRK